MYCTLETPYIVQKGRGRGGERGGEKVEERGGGNGGERRRLVKRHWSGQCPERPFPPIAVVVSADQSVVVQ